MANTYLTMLAECSLGRHIIAGPPDSMELAKHSA